MPKCKKCNTTFPASIKIDNKKVYLHRRSYCLSCSPLNSNTGQKLKRHKNKNKKCPLCNRIFPWNKNNICSSCRTGMRRCINREKAIQMLGGKCKCGIEDPDILTFHHLDPKKKDFDLCERWHLAWADIEKELAKCQLLCYNCHMKLHCPERKKYMKMVEAFRSSGEMANTQDYWPNHQVKSCAH